MRNNRVADFRERITVRLPDAGCKGEVGRFKMKGKSLRVRIPSGCVSPLAGLDPKNAFTEDIKRKDFVVVHALTEKDTCDADFMDRRVDFTKQPRHS